MAKSETNVTKSAKPQKIDPSQMVTVYNGFQGRLVYISSRTGEIFVWDEFGGEQEMELRELRNAKNSAKTFFINNWFMFSEDDAWVIDYLGLGMYYKNSLNIEEFDSIFSLSPEDIKNRISVLPHGQKKSLIYKAKKLYSHNEIDSNRVIRAIEDSLGIKLSAEG